MSVEEFIESDQGKKIIKDSSSGRSWGMFGGIAGAVAVIELIIHVFSFAAPYQELPAHVIKHDQQIEAIGTAISSINVNLASINRQLLDIGTSTSQIRATQDQQAK